MFTLPNVLPVLLALVGGAALVVGVLLLTGVIKLPPEKERKLTIGSIALGIVLAVCGLLLSTNPQWVERWRAKYRPAASP